ncbi:hypothetical protein [Streptosporangium sandarakinum]|uniref:hypothetical protein n=1 Tax=Streptosporangium sandarakinum TaxID=1260955 RepID=UPI0034339492
MRTKITAVAAAILAAAAFGGVQAANAAPAPQAGAAPYTGTALHTGAAPYGEAGPHAGAAPYTGTAHDTGTERHADGTPHSAAVRYASVRGCSDKEGVQYPCGKWRLVTHMGEVRKLADARITPLSAKGRPQKYSVAPIEVSGDGLHVAYFRKSDGRLVVREIGGGVRVMSGTLPAHVGMGQVTLILSQDGARLAVTFPENPKAPSRVYDTASGELLWTVPGDRRPVGFSADDDELLAYREVGEDESYKVFLYVIGQSGEQLHREAPGGGGAYGPYGLAADGTTVVTTHEKRGRTDVVVHDLASSRVVTRVPVGKSAPETLAWTGPEQVTAHFITYDGGARPSRVRVLQIDTTTKKTRVRESYKVLSDTFAVATCGG